MATATAKAPAKKRVRKNTEQKMLGKTGVTPLIVLQFRMLLSLVPSFIPEREKKPAQEKIEVPGKQIIVPTKSVGLAKFVLAILKLEYELVDCNHEPYTQEKGGQKRQMSKVRFVFAIRDRELAPEFLAQRNAMMEALNGFVKGAMWQVQGHMNALYREHVIVPGLYSISIDANSREVLIDKDGKAITRTRKYKDGRHRKVKLTAKSFLVIRGNSIFI